MKTLALLLTLISQTSLAQETHKSAVYHMGNYLSVLTEKQFLEGGEYDNSFKEDLSLKYENEIKKIKINENWKSCMMNANIFVIMMDVSKEYASEYVGFIYNTSSLDQIKTMSTDGAIDMQDVAIRVADNLKGARKTFDAAMDSIANICNMLSKN